MNPFELAVIDLEFREKLIRWLVESQRIGPVLRGRYVSKDEVIRRCTRDGYPERSDSLWFTIKYNRESARRKLPLLNEAGTPFWVEHDLLFNMAMRLSRADTAPELHTRTYESAVPAWLRESVFREEAIASCLLDGLAVDRATAREMLENGRGPQSREERAVRQVYDVLRYVVRNPLYDAPSPEWVLDLHRMLSEGVTEIRDSPGRLRQADELTSSQGSAPLDVPAPPARELPRRLDSLCQILGYASREPSFLPIERALVAHLWIGYERPFDEGNGRLGRVLHYAMLADSYGRWPTAAGLVALSPWLLRVRNSYRRWFRQVRENENDAGYFFHPQLGFLNRGVDRVLNRMAGIRAAGATVKALRPNADLGDRHLETLSYVLHDPNRQITIDAHRRRHGVVYQTARTDLLSLAELGLLEQVKAGRAFAFRATPLLVESRARVHDPE